MKRYQRVAVLVETDTETAKVKTVESNDYVIMTVWNNEMQGRMVIVESGRMTLGALVTCAASEKARWFPNGSRVVGFQIDGQWIVYPYQE